MGNELKLIETIKYLESTCRKIIFQSEEYYMIEPSKAMEFNGMKIAIEGVVEEKPLLKTISPDTGWGAGVKANGKEEHAHLTILKIRGLEVVFAGIASVKRGEPIVVYGKVRGDIVQAKAIENRDVIYVRR